MIALLLVVPTFPGCTSPAVRDATYEDAFLRDVSFTEARDVPDAFDAADGIPADVGFYPLDVAVGDSVIADGGACSVLMSPLVIASEGAVRTRPVWNLGDMEDVDTTVVAHRNDTDAVFFFSMGLTGSYALSGPGSINTSTARLSGGSVARNASQYILAYTSNESGSDEVYVNAVQHNSWPFGSRLLVSATGGGTPSDPQILEKPPGWIVAWRSDAAAILTSVIGFGAATRTPPMPVTPAGATIVSYRLVGSPFVGSYATVYLDQRADGRHLVVQPLSASGVPATAATEIAHGDLGDDLDAVNLADDVVVVWSEPSVAPLLHVQRVGVSSGGLGTSSPAILMGLSGPPASLGIDVDGAAFALAYRSGVAPVIDLVLVRLDASFGVRDSSHLFHSANGGRVAVASTTMNRYGLGWADDFTTGTVTQAALVQCP